MTALRKQLESLPRESLVPVGWVLDQISETDGIRWVSAARASEITGMKPSTLRAAALRWSQQPAPQIQVTKNGPAKGSPWLFDEAGCWAYRRASGVLLVAEAVDEDEDITAYWVKRATANL